MPPAKAFVDAKIREKKVVVFSMSTCPFCTKAKLAFKNHLGKELMLKDYEVIEIERNPDRNDIQNYLQTITGARSVPRVFINGKFIGGGNEIEALEKHNKLGALLR